MNTSDDDGRPLVDGRFRLVSRLGSGGMGTVWRARDIALHRDVALKEVRPPDPAVEEANPGFAAQLRERAVREARALARLSNPHVVTIHHIVEPPDGSHPWIVMELVEGRSLYDRLAEGPMPVAEAVTLGRQVLSALRAAHAAGIQHRDVKPANVLLRPDGSAVLTDFGIAAFDEATSRLTSSGDLIGSAEFIAPERVRGEEGNPASDLWSLGMLLYVATEGHHPLRRATSLATVVAVLDDPIPAPVRSGALTPVLDRILVRDPALRPDGAQLEQLLAEAETRSGTGQGQAAPATPGGAVPPAPGIYTPPYAHPAYGSPAGYGQPLAPHGAPAPGGFGPPVPAPTVPGGAPVAAPTVPSGAPRPTGARPGRRAAVLVGSLAVATAVVVGAVNLIPDGGDKGDGAKGGSTPSNSSRTPGGSTGATAARTPTTVPAAGGSLLTTAGARTVIEAFRKASGSTTMKELTIYEDYALAAIPTRPGAKSYDSWEYRGGVARKAGPGGTINASFPDEQPMDVAAMPWDTLPALMKRGEKELKVENPNMRYVVVERWTFNDDRPTMRFYLTNEYSATGYLAADDSGKVVSSHPAD
ncbi:protein kinase [Streptomyces sp. NPDC053431]|uniref:protein kinase domain-containing protein n=1 Tax=Streptomyces sp. NPDC053431 TaxID=3365703 RepID=UPI0037CDBF1D